MTSAKTGRKKKKSAIKKLGFCFGILAFVAQWHNKAWNTADFSNLTNKFCELQNMKWFLIILFICARPPAHRDSMQLVKSYKKFLLLVSPTSLS